MARRLKRRNHVISRFYLQRFSAIHANRDHGQVIRVELPGGRKVRISTNDASVVKDFYLVPASDGNGELTDVVEDSLGELETEAAKAVREVVDEGTWPIPADARERIAAWIAMQHLRAPRARRVMSEVDRLLVDATRNAGGPQRTIADQTGEDERIAYRTPHVQSMLEAFLPATRSIYDRGWHLIRFTRKALGTSDTPVTLMPIPGADENTPFGLTSNDGILVPLDRRVALMMIEEPGDSVLRGNARTAKKFNHLVALSAQELLFHHPDDDPFCGIQLPEPQDVELRIEQHGIGQ